jgi:hypothetical protein
LCLSDPRCQVVTNLLQPSPLTRVNAQDWASDANDRFRGKEPWEVMRLEAQRLTGGVGEARRHEDLVDCPADPVG